MFEDEPFVNLIHRDVWKLFISIFCIRKIYLFMFYNIAIFILKYNATIFEGNKLNGLYNKLTALCLFLRIEDDA